MGLWEEGYELVEPRSFLALKGKLIGNGFAPRYSEVPPEEIRFDGKWRGMVFSPLEVADGPIDD